MRFTKKNTLVEQEKEKYINAAPLEEKKKVRNYYNKKCSKNIVITY